MGLTGVRIFAVFAATLHSHSIWKARAAGCKIHVILSGECRWPGNGSTGDVKGEGTIQRALNLSRSKRQAWTKASTVWPDQQICHLKMGQGGSSFLLPPPLMKRGQSRVGKGLLWPQPLGWGWWQENAPSNPLPGCESTWSLLQFTSASNCSYCFYAENLSGCCKWISVRWCACRYQERTCWMQMMERVSLQRSRCGCFPDLQKTSKKAI